MVASNQYMQNCVVIGTLRILSVIVISRKNLEILSTIKSSFMRLQIHLYMYLMRKNTSKELNTGKYSTVK